ncbi:MAG: glycosyltransferase, partial [Gaiellaceae bacterium]
MNASPPLVSVVLPVRDGERFVARAVASVLRQSLRELELIVVEDASADATGAILSEIADERLVVVRNERPLGLAASLNLGLERARGRYVARMDADDISLPRRLERQLVRLRCAPAVGIVGSGVTEIDEQDRLGATHLLPSGGVVTRWRSLFGTPFLHPTVLFERALVERLGLRYDESYEAGEPEDYELWVRLLAHCEGDNMPAALLLYRRHAKQASELRRVDQLERRRQIATEQIRAVAPALTPAQAELARLVGDAGRPGAKDAAAAGDAFLSLLEAFEGQARPHSAERQALRGLAAGSLARLAASAEGAGRVRLVRRALALDPALAPREIGLRSRRRRVASSVAREAPAWLASLARGEPGQRAESRPLRVAVVSPEPTPYRSPLFDRVAERPEIDLTVFYAAETLIDRAWQIELRHRHRVLAGFRVPGLRRLLRHDYRVTPGIAAALGASRPDVVVVTGWSTFSSQAAVVWCRLHRVPFLLL